MPGTWTQTLRKLGLKKSRPRTSQTRSVTKRRKLFERLEDRRVLAAFTEGNLLVNRIGEGGTTALSNAAASVALVEVSTSGTVSQTIQVSTLAGSGTVTDSGTAASNGYFNVFNGVVGIPGYNAAVGTTSVAGTNTKVGTIMGSDGELASRTLFPTSGTPLPFNGNNLRSLLPLSQDTFYASGTGGSGTGGVWYYDGSSFTQLNTTLTNTRNVEAYGGQLYVSTGAGTRGIYSLGDGLPTATAQTSTLIIGTGASSEPYGFVMFDTDNNGILDSAYVADERATNTEGGLQKWTFNGTSWSLSWARRITATNGLNTATSSVSGFRGLTGTFADGVATLYATTTETNNNRLVSIVDVGTTIPTTATLIASAGSNFVFRGVDFSPVSSATAGITIVESGGSTNVVEGGASDSYTIVLNTQPTADVTIAINNSNGQLTLSPTTVTFTSENWNTPQTITVGAVDDQLVEGPHSGSITHVVTSADSSYNNFAIAPISVSVTDNDSPGVSIVQSAGTTVVAEGGATDSYTVVLATQPSADVVITLGTGGQVTASPTPLTFTTSNWNVAQMVTVTAIDDLIAEGPHTDTINHTIASADTNYNNLVINNVTANITDNDFAGVTIVQSDGATDVVEGGATDTYTLVLNSQPTADVTIAINPNSQLTVDPTSVVFTALNWNVPQTITVTAVDDSSVEGTHTGLILHAISSADLLYNAISISNIVALIQDNDLPSSFVAGNLAILLASASANNTTAAIVEIDPTDASQSAIQTIGVSSAGPNAVRISGSASSTGYVSRSNDRSLLSFTGHNSANSSSNANTLTSRAVVAFGVNGIAGIDATYIGNSGQQTRGATTLNNNDWFIADQAGIYTNDATSASPTGNFRSIKAFGGTVYAFTASTSSPPVGTISAPTGGVFTALPGLANGTAQHQDFYLVSSGVNGDVFDVLYVLRTTSATAGTIAKHSLVAGDWVENGTYTTNFGGFGLAAFDNDPTDVINGATLFVTSGTGATAGNVVNSLFDAAGYNADIDITLVTTLFTAPAGTILKGLDFVPETILVTPTVSVTAPNAVYSAVAYAGASVSITGSASPVPTATFTYFVGTDATGTPLDSPPINVGTYTVVASTAADAGNNAATSAPVTFQITPAPLTISASSASKTYGSVFTPTAFTTGTLFNGDTVTGVTLTSAGSPATATVAGSPYSIVASAATGTGLSNYSITYVDGSLTVNAAPLSVVANPVSKTVGAADPALTFNATGFVGGENAGNALTGTLTRDSGDTVGQYSILQGTLEALNGNYDISFTGAIFEITALATPVITVTAPDKIYDRVIYAASFLVSGGNEPITPPEILLEYYSANEAVAGNAITAPVNAGTYWVRAVYAGNSLNNAVTTALQSFTVTPKLLTATVTVLDKVFDGNTDATIDTRTLDGILSGDVVSLIGGVATFNTPAVGPNKPVLVVDLQLSGANAGNYVFNSPVNTTATIGNGPSQDGPEVTSVQINGADSYLNNNQRSQLTSVRVNFDQAVTLASGAFRIENANTGVAIAASQLLITPNGASDSFTIRFAVGPGVVERLNALSNGNSLVDGNYRLVIDASKVSAGGGTMASDFVYGNQSVDNFFRLFGDSDGDGDVDARDMGALRLAIRGLGYNAALDANGNGVIVGDTADLDAFAVNRNQFRPSL